MSNNPIKTVVNGILNENPTFVLVVGMCPTLAVTTNAANGIGMGLSTTAVLMFSNLFISLLRNFIPDKVRIPAFVVVIASFVTIVELLLKAFLPELDKALGIYIPLIVVNCIIMARAEAFAYKNKPVTALLDGIGMGLGFTLALIVMGGVRELFGSGSLFGYTLLPEAFPRTILMILPPGAFLTLGSLIALFVFVKGKAAKKHKERDRE